MGKYRRPWDFGISPSEYIKSMKNREPYVEKAVKELGEGAYRKGLEWLDSLFSSTLDCPPLRIIEPELRKCVEGTGTKDAVLVASHARPGCYFFTSDKEYARSFFSDPGTISRLGVFHLKDLEKPTGDPEADGMGALNMSFSPDINDECVKITDELNRKKVSKSAYDMVMGISYGYPVGDVIELANGNPPLLSHRNVLSHFINPDSWTDLWRERVGMEGEEELARIYRTVLGKDAAEKD